MTDILRLCSVFATFIALGLLIANILRVRGRVEPPLRGYLWGLTASYVLFGFGTVIEIQVKYGTPFTWRTVIAAAAAALGLGVQVWGAIKWRRNPP